MGLNVLAKLIVTNEYDFEVPVLFSSVGGGLGKFT